MASNYKEIKVISYPEVVGIILLSISLLVLFFPKNSIQNHINEEKSNHDLNILYLKSIVKAYPDDSDNWLRLVKAYIQMGSLKEASEALSDSKEFATLDIEDVEVLSYRLLKEKFTSETDNSQKEKFLAQMKTKLKSFIDSDNSSAWYFAYHQASSLALLNLSFDALKKRIYHSRFIEADEIVRAFFSGKKLGKEYESIALVEYAIQKSESEKLTSLYRGYYEEKKEYKKLGDFYAKKYRENSVKDDFFYATQYYFLDKNKTKAISFLENFEDDFVDDDNLSKKIINLYLSNSKLKKARSFSIKVMKHRGVL